MAQNVMVGKWGLTIKHETNIKNSVGSELQNILKNQHVLFEWPHKLTKSWVLATKGPDIQSAEQIMQSQVEAS